MLIKKPKRDARYKGQSLAQRGKHRVGHTANYVSKNGEIAPAYTNLASDDLAGQIKEMEAWKTLRPGLTDPVEHRVLSFEKNDRIPTQEEIQKIIDIFREERGLGDALFAAFPHTDGHDDRHPVHLHMMYLRIKSDGSVVPDSKDYEVHVRAARRIERELGFVVNASPDGKNKGTDQRIQRERSAERQGIDIQKWHVNPDSVAAAIAQSSNISELRRNLEKQGIEMRTRERNGEIYAWSVRNIDGPKEWTSGSKITASNDFGWKKVADKLAENKAKPANIKLSTIQPQNRWPAPRRRLRIDTNPKAPANSRRPPKVDIGKGLEEGLEMISELFNAASRDANRVANAVKKPIPGNSGIDIARRAAMNRAANPVKTPVKQRG